MQKPLIVLHEHGGLLVVLCAINVATLLLLRAAGRAREMSMRYALGAKRSRIISQLMVEGGLLGLAGAAAGLAACAHRGSDAGAPDDQLRSRTASRIPLPSIRAFCSLPSPFRWSLPSFSALLRRCISSSRSGPDACGKMQDTASKSSQRFRKLAVGAQIALSVLLLGGAGLFVRTLDNLRRQPVGLRDVAHRQVLARSRELRPYGEDALLRPVMDSMRRRQHPRRCLRRRPQDAELAGDNSAAPISPSRATSLGEDENMNFERPLNHAGLLCRRCTSRFLPGASSPSPTLKASPKSPSSISHSRNAFTARRRTRSVAQIARGPETT